MAAYFFDAPLVLGNTAFYDASSGGFYADPDRQGRFIPPAEALRYRGPLAVIVGPSCVSACEFFTYDLTLEGRAEVVGHYPTAGGGGSVEVFRMPLDAYVRFTVGRSVDADGDIHIEGQGIAPTIDVPVTEATLLGEGDALVAAAVKHLDEAVAAAER
jgi:carboxyl-terminal processing protease